MAEKRLKVGVIGTGGIAQAQHLPHWQELASEGRVELVGVCDVLPERAQEVAAKFGAKHVFANYSKMLRNGGFDIIDVCTQNRLHCPVTVAALEAGANVLVEKPIAMTAREAQRMVDAAKKAHRKLMVAQHMRFETENEKLKEVVDSGQLGKIYVANTCLLRRRGIPGWGKFHIKRESLGGPLIDIGVHMIDLVVWLMGSPKPVAASGKVYRMFGDRADLFNAAWGADYPRAEFDVEDYATGFVRFEDDITLTVEVSWAANIPEDRLSLTVLGDKAGISKSPLGVYGYENNSLTSTRFDWIPKEGAHRKEIRHFADCVQKKLPVRVRPAESLRIQKIIDAIYESSKKNKEVAIK